MGINALNSHMFCGGTNFAYSQAQPNTSSHDWMAPIGEWGQLAPHYYVLLFDNGGPNNMHAEPCIAAAQAGKHVFCEKPLARTAEEAKRMFDAVTKADVKHMVAFNYRFVPAIRQARNLIESGALGDLPLSRGLSARVGHAPSQYIQDLVLGQEVSRKRCAG